MFTKSDLLIGLQCPLYAWKKQHAPHDLEPLSVSQRARMDAGKSVGLLARALYPDGVVLEGTVSDPAVLTRVPDNRTPLFEAGFMYDGCFARADILLPGHDGSWDVVEVKSTTAVKDEHYTDVAFQLYVYEGAGLRINTCSILYLNPDYVRRGELRPAVLFMKEDVTSVVRERKIHLAGDISRVRLVHRSAEAPTVVIGEQCTTPHHCPLMSRCFAHIPENSVLDLYGLRKYQAFELIHKGIMTFDQLPPGYHLNERQHIQVRTTLSGTVHTDVSAIRSFLSLLKYPVHYLDFESFAPAVPLFEGTHPHEHVPFQYSLHIERSPGAPLEHLSFLSEGTADPRGTFIRSVCAHVGNTGSVVVYNRQFEGMILNACAKQFPAYADQVRTIIGRIVDLLVPFRNFEYYNPLQQGSASIKYVLPALVGTSYEGMAIGDGETASHEYYRVTYTDDHADRAEVYAHLKEYCGLDTKAMVDIVHALQRSS